MTPDDLAALHRHGFVEDRPWSAQEFSNLLGDPHITLLHRAHGFALTRTVADESELLTLVVHPDHRREGTAASLLKQWMTTAVVTRAFLEVAADNHAAQALYAKHRFAEAGRRRAYYRRAGAASVDAVLMTAALPHRQPAESPDKP